MARAKEGTDYSLQVKLLELRTLTLDPKTLRLYQKPSEMNMFPESTLIEKNAEEFLKYGISERRIGINQPINKEANEARVSSNFKKLEEDERYSTPDFISNQNSLKYLMTPDEYRHVLFKATKCPGTTAVDIRIVEPSWHSDVQSTGYVMKSILSTTAEAVRESQQLRGQFHASLGKMGGDEEITLAYTAQLDGLKFSEDRRTRLTNATSSFQFTADDLANVVAVKAINTKSFCPYVNLEESSKPERYAYEHKFLRRNWAQCQLTGVKTMLCGIVGFEEDDKSASDLKLKEVWNYVVNEIPEIVKRRVSSTDGWQGRFPCSILTASEKARFEETVCYYKPWAEQQILCEFHKTLTGIKDEMRNSSAPVKYFIYTKNSEASGGRLMVPIATSWNEELDRINACILLRVPVPDGSQVGMGARKSVQDILFGLAATEDQGFGFLRDWFKNVKYNLKVPAPRRGSDGNCLAILTFQSQEEATRVLRAMEVQGIHCWEAHNGSNLERVLRKSFSQRRM